MDSADEAQRFLHGHGVPEDSIRRVWTAIAPHPRPHFKRSILQAFTDGNPGRCLPFTHYR